MRLLRDQTPHKNNTSQSAAAHQRKHRVESPPRSIVRAAPCISPSSCTRAATNQSDLKSKLTLVSSVVLGTQKWVHRWPARTDSLSSLRALGVALLTPECPDLADIKG